jgi:transposase
VAKVQVEVEEKEFVTPPWSGGERSEPERNGGVTNLAPADVPRVPDPEVSAKPARRRFTAEYKRRILKEADACGPGGIVALLRREGLYSSHLVSWRRQREQGEEAALSPHKRGRKTTPRNPFAAENARLQRENERLQKRLRQAETIIDVQKKLCEMLGLPVATTESNGSEE